MAQTYFNPTYATLESSSDEQSVNSAITYIYDAINKSTQISFAGVIQPLTSPLTANYLYNSIPKTSGTYKIYIPAAYLVAASGGPYNLTLTAGASGATNYIISISPQGDTILSGDLLFDIYVSSSGNIAGYSWSVSGSNSNGTYIKFGDGTLICRNQVSGGPINISYSSYYYFNTKTNFAYTFSGLPYVIPGSDGAAPYSVHTFNTNTSWVYLEADALSNAYSFNYFQYIAIGRWK